MFPSHQVGLAVSCGCYFVNEYCVFFGTVLRWIQSLLISAFGLALVYYLCLPFPVFDGYRAAALWPCPHHHSCGKA